MTLMQFRWINLMVVFYFTGIIDCFESGEQSATLPRVLCIIAGSTLRKGSEQHQHLVAIRDDR